MTNTLYKQHHVYSRFSPSRATAAALGIERNIYCIGSFLLKLLQAYTIFHAKSNERLSHLVLFDDILSFRQWMKILSEDLRAISPVDARDGWIAGTNIFLGYYDGICFPRLGMHSEDQH